MTITETTITTNRGTFAARTIGTDTNPLVLCLHGFPDYPATFDRLATDLAAASYRVVSTYMRGHASSPTTGSLAMADLAANLLALIDVLSPTTPVYLVAHDYGAQIAYEAITAHPNRFQAVANLAVEHPAIIGEALRKHPKELWTLCHIGLFQLKGFGEKWAARNNFAYIEKLWRRWAPGYSVPTDYLNEVKEVFRNSWPNPIAMYRAGVSTPQTRRSRYRYYS
ncbi:MAG: alpha/beta fold hydrolase [Corynebacterium sp.]|nr:alpha/beta fold hydrolase [Corynebacterium sp.]